MQIKGARNLPRDSQSNGYLMGFHGAGSDLAGDCVQPCQLVVVKMLASLLKLHKRLKTINNEIYYFTEEM